MNDSPASARSLANFRILLVEDCPDQQRLYLRRLQQSGADVTVEGNGATAVATMVKQNLGFDAVITDLQMPIMDGLQATVAMRHLGYQGPIVAISAQRDPEFLETFLAAGCNVLLEKPVNQADLTEQVLRLSEDLG